MTDRQERRRSAAAAPRRRARGNALRPPRAAVAGFTLIEVLLAAVLLAAGLAVAFATLRAATAIAQRGEAMAQRNERMRAVEDFLRRRLTSALVMAFEIDPGTGLPLRFVGEPERMRFVADLPSYLGRGGPYLHDVAVVDDGGGARLVVSLTMVLAGELVPEREARPPEPLVRNLVQARFRYRGMDQENRLGPWADRWERYDQLPLQVQVEILDTQGRAWPTLVVALPQSSAPPTGREPLQ